MPVKKVGNQMHCDALMHCGVRPRHYAAAYRSAGNDREKQRLALAGCPVEWRDLVRAHINNAQKKPCGICATGSGAKKANAEAIG